MRGRGASRTAVLTRLDQRRIGGGEEHERNQWPRAQPRRHVTTVRLPLRRGDLERISEERAVFRFNLAQYRSVHAECRGQCVYNLLKRSQSKQKQIVQYYSRIAYIVCSRVELADHSIDLLAAHGARVAPNLQVLGTSVATAHMARLSVNDRRVLVSGHADHTLALLLLLLDCHTALRLKLNLDARKHLLARCLQLLKQSYAQLMQRPRVATLPRCLGL